MFIHILFMHKNTTSPRIANIKKSYRYRFIIPSLSKQIRISCSDLSYPVILHYCYTLYPGVMPPAAAVHRSFHRRDYPSFLPVTLVLVSVFVALSARCHVTEAVKIDISCSCTMSRNKVIKKPATCHMSPHNISYTACCKKKYPLASNGMMSCTFAAIKKKDFAKGSNNSTLKPLPGGEIIRLSLTDR